LFVSKKKSFKQGKIQEVLLIGLIIHPEGNFVNDKKN